MRTILPLVTIDIRPKTLTHVDNITARYDQY